MLTEKSSILQMLPDACVWAVHAAVWVSGGVSGSGVSVVFICSLFRVLMVMFTVPWLMIVKYISQIWKYFSLTETYDGALNKILNGTTVFLHYCRCSLHNCLLLLKVLNVKEKTLPSMEKMSIYYNCKHHKMNVECFYLGWTQCLACTVTFSAKIV